MRIVRLGLAMVVALGLALTLTLTVTVPMGALGPVTGAQAAPPPQTCGYGGCTGGDGGDAGGSGGMQSSGTVRENYGGGGQSCSVYANGTGMGAYCVRLGGGTAKSLRERFPNLTLEKCRYREIPDGVPAPFNANPDRGRYMLQICLQHIDFDTYSGGANRSIKVDIVFVTPSVAIEDDNNPLNQFVWRSIEQVEQLPVPFMVSRPNPTPLVGAPTFFTFRWLDPATQEVVRDPRGDYADKPGGGPFKRIVTDSGLVMEAEATEIRIDPRQKDMKAITCRPSTPYNEGSPADQQPANACSITFDRSSALGREFSTAPIPWQIKESFYAMVEVQWRITYGQPGDMRPLGDGFTMRVAQGIKVQEVQAPNQPPIAIY